MEGLQWEASVQADRGDMWPDEHTYGHVGSDDLAALGLTVRKVG